MGHAWLDSLSDSNQWLLGIAAFWALLNGIQQWRYRGWARHRYGIITVSPDGFPVALCQPTRVYLEDGNPSGAYKDAEPDQLLRHAWFKASAYPVTFARKPLTVTVDYLSVTEQQCYRGTFTLPRANRNRAIRYFKWHPKQQDNHGDGRFVSYVIGLCARGTVQIWLNGNTLKHRGPLVQRPIAQFKAMPYTPETPEAQAALATQLALLSTKISAKDATLIAEYQPLFTDHAFWSLEAFLHAVAPLQDRRAQLAWYFKNFAHYHALLEQLESLTFAVHALSEPLFDIFNSYLVDAIKTKAEAPHFNRLFRAFFRLNLSPIAGTSRDEFYGNALIPLCQHTLDPKLGERMLKAVLRQPVNDRRVAFNLACLYAGRKQKQALLHYMHLALTLGSQPTQFKTDADFHPYQQDIDFLSLCDKFSPTLTTPSSPP